MRCAEWLPGRWAQVTPEAAAGAERSRAAPHLRQPFLGAEAEAPAEGVGSGPARVSSGTTCLDPGLRLSRKRSGRAGVEYWTAELSVLGRGPVHGFCTSGARVVPSRCPVPRAGLDGGART